MSREKGPGRWVRALRRPGYPVSLGFHPVMATTSLGGPGHLLGHARERYCYLREQLSVSPEKEVVGGAEVFENQGVSLSNPAFVYKMELKSLPSIPPAPSPLFVCGCEYNSKIITGCERFGPLPMSCSTEMPQDQREIKFQPRIWPIMSVTGRTHPGRCLAFTSALSPLNAFALHNC